MFLTEIKYKFQHLGWKLFNNLFENRRCIMQTAIFNQSVPNFRGMSPPSHLSLIIYHIVAKINGRPSSKDFYFIERLWQFNHIFVFNGVCSCLFMKTLI